jgi:hypothetical protein
MNYLDNDVSKLIGVYINYKNNFNNVLKELKDNVLFITQLISNSNFWNLQK